MNRHNSVLTHYKKLMLDNEALNEDEYITAWYMVPWIPRNPHGKDFSSRLVSATENLRIRKIQADIHGFQNNISFPE